MCVSRSSRRATSPIVATMSTIATNEAMSTTARRRVVPARRVARRQAARGADACTSTPHQLEQAKRTYAPPYSEDLGVVASPRDPSCPAGVPVPRTRRSRRRANSIFYRGPLRSFGLRHNAQRRSPGLHGAPRAAATCFAARREPRATRDGGGGRAGCPRHVPGRGIHAAPVRRRRGQGPGRS